jgi:hypothetical protein
MDKSVLKQEAADKTQKKIELLGERNVLAIYQALKNTGVPKKLIKQQMRYVFRPERIQGDHGACLGQLPGLQGELKTMLKNLLQEKARKARSNRERPLRKLEELDDGIRELVKDRTVAT